MRQPLLLLVLALAGPAVLEPRALADTLTLSEHAPSTREEHPWTVSAAVSFFALGVDASYQLSDRWALGAQAATALVLHNDLSLRARYFPLARPTWGLYVGAGLHFLPYSPVV